MVPLRSSSRPWVKDTLSSLAHPLTTGPRRPDGWEGGKAIRRRLEEGLASVRVTSETDVQQLNPALWEYTCEVDWVGRLPSDKTLTVRVWMHDAVQYYDCTVYVF